MALKASGKGHLHSVLRRLQNLTFCPLLGMPLIKHILGGQIYHDLMMAMCHLQFQCASEYPKLQGSNGGIDVGLSLLLEDFCEVTGGPLWGNRMLGLWTDPARLLL